MLTKSPSIEIKIFDAIRHLARHAWDQLTYPNTPFADFAFLNALEESRCVGIGTGWMPRYITAWQHETMIGATVVYLKTNSYGEYIFDWEWAKAYHRHGINFFPKLTGSIPFTPATTPKFLVNGRHDQNAIVEALLDATMKLGLQEGCTSSHFLFVPENELPYFADKSYLIRHSFQYHWQNQSYANFDAFLATLKSKRRKQIIRERTQLKTSNLSMQWITGDKLEAAHADLFYGFYQSTIQKMSAIAYLNLDFFRNVFQTMRDKIALMFVFEGGEAIAGALYFKKGDALFGRYWGASKDIRNLHFDVCYYQPIEWAIANGITRFEAGAQGEHKIARGLLPELTYSAHFIEHPDFRNAIAHFIDQEKVGIQRYFEEVTLHSPYT